MHDEPSPLLAQVPLTVSPFINLPKPPTLPHNYASLPSTLPPSILNTPPTNPTSPSPPPPPPYVTAPNSTSGFSAHPSQIIAQNTALLARLRTTEAEAGEKVQQWEREIRERELQEKRRRAPGWLDRDEKMLSPARKGPGDLLGGEGGEGEQDVGRGRDEGPGEVGGRGQKGRGGELGAMMDRAFGGLG
ncbi:hypothetical protein BDZ85DRAFT_291117 [Elsinoe ampelina]|uniref:Uncharacterized protein n=1 Tax=Elsinoe ampelina TaxID=302913 RepID=A0A6A6G550_9PEZI|nr:hypothetical protein BDZ85DRAFT_291117 [Elsinoe ampelina]